MSRRSDTLPGRILDLLSSYGLTIVVLSFLLFLTWRGTLEQTEHSLYDVVKRYFESLVVLIDVGPLKVPFPGVYPLLWVLCINLIAGGIVRIRKNTATAGVIVAHVGILLLMGGSLVEYLTSHKGHTTLLEGGQADEFESYHEWELTIASPDGDGPYVEWVAPGEAFEQADRDSPVTLTSAAFPFELRVT